MFNDIRQWFLGKKTRKNTSKMFDKGNKEVYNINIKLNQTRKRGAQCLIEKKGSAMFNREKWDCFNALEHYLKQRGIDLDSVADKYIEMDESATLYLVSGVQLEGVSVTIENECDEKSVTYLVPLLEYNSEVDYYSSELEGTIYESIVWKDKKYYVFVENE